MSTPPFTLVAQPREISFVPMAAPHPHAHAPESFEELAPATTRRRLADLDGHLHCSVIGTCLGTGELRKLMARHLDVQDADDLEVHHETVRLISDGGVVARAVQKALDHKHDGSIRQAARLRGTAALLAWWKEALRLGEVPGAYWAVLTHRDATFDTLKQVFGDVHMLSHLVGSANRADIRRLASLEEDNGQLQRTVADLQRRLQVSFADREREIATLEDRLVAARRAPDIPVDDFADEAARAAVAEAALQRERAERWERIALDAHAETVRLREDAELLRRRAVVIEAEMASVEAELGRRVDPSKPSASQVEQLRDRRILYVGGRPGSNHAIRDLVVRNGGSFRGHDGGLEDRKGLLASAVAGSDVVVFPVDCVDHDSVGNLKRLCGRLQVPFIPLRSTGIASFMTAMTAAPPGVDA